MQNETIEHATTEDILAIFVISSPDFSKISRKLTATAENT